MKTLIASLALGGLVIMLVACEKTEGGLTFKDGDFECSQGESTVKFDPGPSLPGFLQLFGATSGDDESSSNPEPDDRTQQILLRAAVCAEFLRAGGT